MSKRKRCPNCGRYRVEEKRSLFGFKLLNCTYCNASVQEVKKTPILQGFWPFMRIVGYETSLKATGGKKWATNWRKSRKEVLARARNRCQRCWSTNKLHVHHIKPVSKGGTDHLFNLIVLCDSCHKKAHKKR